MQTANTAETKYSVEYERRMDPFQSFSKKVFSMVLSTDYLGLVQTFGKQPCSVVTHITTTVASTGKHDLQHSCLCLDIGKTLMIVV